MKMLCLLLTLFLATGSVMAQSSFYLKAGGGWGGTGARERSFMGRSSSDITHAWHGGLSGGWQKGRWSMELGMGFSRTGGTTSGIYFEQDFDTAFNVVGATPVSARFTFLHRHYTQLLTLGYSLPLSPRWTMQARAGLEGAYNSGATQRIRRDNRISSGGVNSEVYRMTYARYALFSTAAVQAHWRVSRRVGLFSGLGYRRALTNLVRVPSGLPYRFGVRTASATVDAGVLLFLNGPGEGRGTATKPMQNEG